MKMRFSLPYFCCVCACSFLLSPCFGQQKDFSVLIKTIETISGNYANRDIAYKVIYQYSDEKKPDQILDSAAASVEINKGSYHCNINNTEIYGNDSLSLIVFNDEKLLYFSKPKKVAEDADPLAALQNALNDKVIHSCTIDSSKTEVLITIVFQPGQLYKEMRMSINANTGLLSKTEYIVKTEALLDADSQVDDTENAYGAYAFVRAVFTAYDTSPKTLPLFNPSLFLERKGKDFIVSERYKDYQIFKATPGM